MQHALRLLDELTDALRVGFTVAVAGQRIAAAAGFDENVRPDHAGLDVDRRDLGNGDADFVLTEPRAFAADDRLVRDFNNGAEQMIAARPPAGFENLRRHAGSIIQDSGAATGFSGCRLEAGVS